jgi:hypothetical protein
MRQQRALSYLKPPPMPVSHTSSPHPLPCLRVPAPGLRTRPDSVVLSYHGVAGLPCSCELGGVLLPGLLPLLLKSILLFLQKCRLSCFRLSLQNPLLLLLLPHHLPPPTLFHVLAQPPA